MKKSMTLAVSGLVLVTIFSCRVRFEESALKADSAGFYKIECFAEIPKISNSKFSEALAAQNILAQHNDLASKIAIMPNTVEFEDAKTAINDDLQKIGNLKIIFQGAFRENEIVSGQASLKGCTKSPLL